MTLLVVFAGSGVAAKCATENYWGVLLRGPPVTNAGWSENASCVAWPTGAAGAERVTVTQAAPTSEATTTSAAPSPAVISAGTTSWSSIGPSEVAHGAGSGTFPIVSGRITSMAVGPQGRRVYAGSANGGVWLSSDGGSTWRPLDEWATASDTSGLEADALSVGAITVAFAPEASNSNASADAVADTIYVGTGEPGGNLDGYYGIGIKRSTDGGNTFVLEASNLASSEIYRIIIDPVDATIVFAATTTGLYRRPGGPDFSTWIKVSDPDPSSPGGAVTDLAVAGSGTSRTYYAATANQVFESTDITSKTDGTATWTAVVGIINPDPQNNPLRKSLSAGENEKSVLYCLVQDGSLFRLDSSTGGSFQQVRGVPKAIFAGGQGWYDIVVAADPSDANTVYLAGDLTWDGGWALALFKGTISGGTGNYAFPFNPANDQTNLADPSTTNNVPNDATWIGRGIHPDGHALAFATNLDGSHDSTNVWVACDGGVFQSASSGARGSFVTKNAGLAITQMTYFALRQDTPDVMYSGCQDNGTLRYSTSANPPWTQSGSGDGGGVAINPLNTSEGLRQYVQGIVEATGDDGATWGPSGLPVQAIENSRTGFYGPVRAFASGAKTLVAFGTNRLWFRADWSDPWLTLPTNTNPYVGAVNLTQDVLDDTTPTVAADDKLSADPAPITAIAFGSATMILVATSGTSAANVWRFDLVGTSWKKTLQPAISGANAPPKIFITALAIEDPVKGSFYVALGSQGGDHVAYFDGATWMSAGLAAATVDIPAHAIVIDPVNPDKLFLGTDVGVWQGVKSGTTWGWTPFSDGLPESAVVDLAMQTSVRKLRASTHGRGVWEIPV